MFKKKEPLQPQQLHFMHPQKWWRIESEEKSMLVNLVNTNLITMTGNEIEFHCLGGPSVKQQCENPEKTKEAFQALVGYISQ